MDRKYMIVAIALVIIATTGMYAFNVEKHNSEVNAGINKLKEQTKNDAAEKVSKIDHELREAKETKDTETVRKLTVLQSDLKTYEIERVAAARTRRILGGNCFCEQ